MKRPRHEQGELRWDGKVWRRWTGKSWDKAVYSLNPARLKYAPPLDTDTPIDRAARDRLLAAAVEDQLTYQRGHVIHTGPRGVLLAYPRKVSHGLHLILTLFTGGLWGIIWLIDALSRTEDRFLLEVDPWGNVWGTQGRAT